MTRLQFTILLGCYLARVIASFVFGQFSKQMEHATKCLKSESKFFLFAYGSVGTFEILAGLIGFVGMFFLWGFSPFLFFSATAAKLLGPLCISSRSRSGWNQLLNDAEYFFDGTLFVIIFFGPAKHLFF